MKEEDHQIELKEGYEQDEEYEESEDWFNTLKFIWNPIESWILRLKKKFNQ